MLKTVLACIGAVVSFGAILALIAVAAYHVERRWK